MEHRLCTQRCCPMPGPSLAEAHVGAPRLLLSLRISTDAPRERLTLLPGVARLRLLTSHLCVRVGEKRGPFCKTQHKALAGRWARTEMGSAALAGAIKFKLQKPLEPESRGTCASSASGVGVLRLLLLGTPGSPGYSGPQPRCRLHSSSYRAAFSFGNRCCQRPCMKSLGEKVLLRRFWWENHLLWSICSGTWRVCPGPGAWGGGRDPRQQTKTCCSHSWASGHGLERTENADLP